MRVSQELAFELASKAEKSGMTTDDNVRDWLDIETGGELDTTQMDVLEDMFCKRLTQHGC